MTVQRHDHPPVVPPRRADLHPAFCIGQYRLLSRAPDSKSGSAALKKRWRCECVCGKREIVPESYFVRSNPKWHCGCQTVVSIKSTFNQEYRIWTMMRQRCYNNKHVAYKSYGGRGITICDEWLNDETGFETFLRDIGPRPSPKYSIDRIDVNGHYEKIHRVTGKLQVKWATAKEQAQNTQAKTAERERLAAREAAQSTSTPAIPESK